MKRLICLVLSIVMLLSMSITVAYADDGSALPFEDVSINDSYYSSVLWAYENGITSGTSATTFSPFDTCTRAQLVQFLWNKSGKPMVSIENPFKDVKTTDWFYNAVMWAYSTGMVAGTSKDTFSPNNTCTKEQVLVMLWREKGSIVIKGTGFEDCNCGGWAKDAVVWAMYNGICNGYIWEEFVGNEACPRYCIVDYMLCCEGDSNYFEDYDHMIGNKHRLYDIYEVDWVFDDNTVGYYDKDGEHHYMCKQDIFYKSYKINHKTEEQFNAEFEQMLKELETSMRQANADSKNVEGAFDFRTTGIDAENYSVDPEDTNDGVHFH